MFKPHRFNPLLKAEPNQNHAKKVASGLIHGHTHEELVKEVKKTTTVEHGKTHTTTEVVEAKVTTTTTHNGGAKADETTPTLSHVHATGEGLAAIEMTPPHPPREETPEYSRAHHHLTKVLDEPCAMCGVRNSTLNDPKQNPFGATALETHHYPIERSLMDACDPLKVGIVFPQVKDHETLEAFVDSENNLMVLCDVHHRHPLHGIHHLAPQDFFVQPFLIGGYQVVATQEDEAAAMAADEKLVESEEKRKK